MDGDHAPAPNMKRREDGQYIDHWVLAPAERRKKYVRPLRHAYLHLICRKPTRIPVLIAETLAVDPTFYALMYCAHCREYYPSGIDGEFVWCQQGTDQPLPSGLRVGE